MLKKTILVRLLIACEGGCRKLLSYTTLRTVAPVKERLQMAVVTYDDRSLMIDTSRVWLTSGSLHYFRVPSTLWRDRLLKAKRSGLNCISTFIPWNFHQPDEKRWELTGDHDIADFVKLAGELGLYVILKPGPYIGADWDFGGLPGWLTAKSGIVYRTSNASFTHYFDRYFRKVLPRLADLQITHNGTIILIQNENRYAQASMPEGKSYLEFVNQLFSRSGFDIPIISCNSFFGPTVGENIECISLSENPARSLVRLRRNQDRKPMIAVDFESARARCWGKEAPSPSPAYIARTMLEIIGCGGQYNYNMWHGGTNFGFNAGRLWADEESFVTTSYDRGSALAEGGRLTDCYYLTKLVNMFSNHMGQFLSSCRMQEVSSGLVQRPGVLNVEGHLGSWTIITNNGQDDVTTARVWFSDIMDLEVPLAPIGAVAIGVDVELSDGVVLDYSNVMPLGFWGQKVLVFHGPAGWCAQISINGKVVRKSIPKNDEIAAWEHSGVLVVLINSDLAMRTWSLPDGLILGPKYVGQFPERIEHVPGATTYVTISHEGKVSRPKIPAGSRSHKRSPAPRLSTWKPLAQCPEPTAAGADLEWQSIPGPRNVDRLGVHQGYAWYRIEIEQPRAATRRLFLPECGDRATVYLNAKKLGVWGLGEGAAKKPIAAQLKRGTNTLTLLLDNLGRYCEGPNLGEPKGLWGHIYNAKPLARVKFKLSEQKEFSRKLLPRSSWHLLGELDKQKVWSAKANVTLTKVLPIHLSINSAGHHFAIVCNDRPVLFAQKSNAQRSWGEAILGPELRAGKNSLEIIMWGDVDPNAIKNIQLHTLVENLTASARWSWRRWEMPPSTGPVKSIPVPAWFRSSFRCQDLDQPIFLELPGGKGQLFVNGHNVGRFWGNGHNSRYYLPASWLNSENEIVVFEETGKAPQGAKLVISPVV